jgi:hypothetical protein
METPYREGMYRRSWRIVSCVFGSLVWASTALAAGPPSIESEAASYITPTGATLEAQIDPNGLETEYQFRVVAPPCHANPTNCSEGPDPLYPSTPSTIAAGSGPQPASANLHVAGLTLEPGHEYHYAVVAHNEDGTEAGPDQTFTTAHLPSVLSESASVAGPRDETLEAVIDPGGGSGGAYYQFQLSDGSAPFNPDLTCPPDASSGPFLPCFGAHIAGALPISFLPAGSAAVPVSLRLSDAGVSLESGHSYFYRVLVATAVQTEDTIEWEPPAIAGPRQSFVAGGVLACVLATGHFPCEPPGPPRVPPCVNNQASANCGQPPRPRCRQTRHRRRHRHHKHHPHHGYRRCHR